MAVLWAHRVPGNTAERVTGESWLCRKRGQHELVVTLLREQFCNSTVLAQSHRTDLIGLELLLYAT